MVVRVCLACLAVAVLVGCTINIPGGTQLPSALPGTSTISDPVSTTPAPTATQFSPMLIGTWRLKAYDDWPSSAACASYLKIHGITFGADGSLSQAAIAYINDDYCEVSYILGTYQVSGDRLTMTLNHGSASVTWVAEWFINSDGLLFWGTVDHEPNSILINSVYVKVG